MRRQHHVPILAALALLDPDDHPGASMSSTLSEMISDARSRAIGDAQRCLVLEAWCHIQQAGYLLRAEHDRQFPRSADEWQADDDLRLSQRLDEEKPQCGHSVMVGAPPPPATNCS
jgi:hypothetical protein